MLVDSTVVTGNRMSYGVRWVCRGAVAGVLSADSHGTRCAIATAFTPSGTGMSYVRHPRGTQWDGAGDRRGMWHVCGAACVWCSTVLVKNRVGRDEQGCMNGIVWYCLDTGT